MSAIDDLPRDLEILIVDDVPSARKVVSRFLSSLGFDHLSESGSGQEALDLLQQREFHLVVTDLHLKDMLGVDAGKSFEHYIFLELMAYKNLCEKIEL